MAVCETCQGAGFIRQHQGFFQIEVACPACKRAFTPAVDPKPDYPTLDDQIHCVNREIMMRERNYPNWINQGRLKQASADIELARMRAVLESLHRLKDLEK